MALMLTGCVGKNGGGLNHYVGQEKLAPGGFLGSDRVRQGLAQRRPAPASTDLALHQHLPVPVRRDSSPSTTRFPTMT